MKALHVIESLGLGGAEQLLVTLLPELARQGCGVCVAVRGGAMDLEPALILAGVPLRLLPVRHRWRLVACARDIARIARAERATVIHAHLYFPAIAVALLRLLRLHPARTCVTFHNLAYGGANRAGPKLAARRWLASWLYPRGFDLCLGVSTAVARHYEAALGLRHVQVLHNPVDLVTLAAVFAKPDKDHRLHLILPGRIVPEKGHADLLQALAMLREQLAGVRVTFAGDGPLRPAIMDQLRQLGLAAHVTITGALPHAALMEVMAGADLVVMPSRQEGFGLTALEAMALGRPVLASSAGGLPEVLGDTGMQVAPGDVSALAGALAGLIGDAPRRAAMGQGGRTRAGALFALPSIAARLIALYRQLETPRNAEGETR